MRGRPKGKRSEILYTRIVRNNLKFLNQACKKTKMSKSEFIDNILTAMRKTNEKTGNKIPRENKAFT